MDEHYTAESGTVDSLRLETSMATPEQQRILHDTALEVKELIISEYASYIQRDALTRVDHVEDRLILMDKEHFADFYAQWGGTSEKLSGIVFATTTEQGDIVAFNDPAEVWHTFDNKTQQSFIQQFGDEVSARGMVSSISIIDNLTHEVVHQFQDYSRPLRFLEVATRYYQRQTTASLKFGHVDRPDMGTIAWQYTASL